MGWRQRRRQRELDDGDCKEQSRKALKNLPAVKQEQRREDARKQTQEKEKWWKLPVSGLPRKKEVGRRSGAKMEGIGKGILAKVSLASE